MLKPNPYEYSVDLSVDTTATKIIRLVDVNMKVLELGCASGSMSRILRDRGCKITGIEIDSEAAEKSSIFCEKVIVGNLDTIDLDAELGTDSFDVIVAADVLEHLRDPKDLLLRLKPFLSKNGRVIISLPNIGHLSVIASLITGRFDYSETGILDKTHLRFFTPATAAELLTESGFQILKTQFTRSDINHPSLLPYWNNLSIFQKYTLKRVEDVDIYQIILEAKIDNN